MFVFQVEDTYVVLKSRLEGEKDHDCSILCSNSYNQFSRIQTVQALQTFFNIDKDIIHLTLNHVNWLIFFL